MPARDTLGRFRDHLELEQSWDVSGEHYRRTARAWLENLDADREAAAAELASGAAGAAVSADPRALLRWRMFFMACEELFGWQGGREWQVAHYLFRRRTEDGGEAGVAAADPAALGESGRAAT